MTGDTFTTNMKLAKIKVDRRSWADTMNDNMTLIDAIFGAYFVVGNLQGLWTNSTSYQAGQTVVDADSSSVYLCEVDHISASFPTTFLEERQNNAGLWSTYSSPIRARGVWTPNTSYALNDIVVYNARYAVCVEAHISGSDFDADVTAGKWEILIDLTIVPDYLLPSLSGIADANKVVISNAAGVSYAIADGAELRSRLNLQIAGNYQSQNTILDTIVTNGIASTIGVFDTLANAKNVSGRPAIIQLASRTSPGDNGGGTFIWRSGSVATADDILYFEPTGGGGRYQRVFNGPMMIEWGGLTTVGFQAVINLASTLGKEVAMQSGGDYDIDDELVLSVPFDMQGGTLRQITKFKAFFYGETGGKCRNGNLIGEVQRIYNIASITRGVVTAITLTQDHDYVNGNPIYLADMGGILQLNETSNSATVTSANSFTIAVDSLTGKTISNVVDNGSGYCRATVTGHGMTGTYPKEITGVVGTTELNGSAVEVLDIIDADTIDFNVPFVNAYVSGGNVNAYGAWTSGGTSTHRPSTGGLGFGGWQRVSGMFMTGLDNEFENMYVENMFTGFTHRGPVVVDALSSTGYDHTVQSTAARVKNVHTKSCDFIGTGTAAKDGIFENLSWETPTHGTVPNHAVYWQSPTTSRRLITDIVDNGSGLFRITTTGVGGSNGFVDGMEYTIRDEYGCPDANGTWIISRISGLVFDLVGSTFAGTFSADTAGSVGPRSEGFMTNCTFRNIAVRNFTFAVTRTSEALKGSNMDSCTWENIFIEDCQTGGLTLSYSWNCKVNNIEVKDIWNSTYAVRTTDDFGDDNIVSGGLAIGKRDAQYLAVTHTSGGKRFKCDDFLAVIDFAGTAQGSIRTYNVSTSDGTFTNCREEHLRDNNGFAYGTSTGQITINYPQQVGRRGLFRGGLGSNAIITLAKTQVENFDANSALCINTSGTYTLLSMAKEETYATIISPNTGFPSLIGASVTGTGNVYSTATRIGGVRAGNLCEVGITVRLTTKGTMSGEVIITNLPWTVYESAGSNPDIYAGNDLSIAAGFTSLPGTGPLYIEGIQNTKTARLYYYVNSATGSVRTYLTDANFTNTTQFSASLIYRTSDP